MYSLKLFFFFFLLLLFLFLEVFFCFLDRVLQQNSMLFLLQQNLYLKSQLDMIHMLHPTFHLQLNRVLDPSLAHIIGQINFSLCNSNIRSLRLYFFQLQLQQFDLSRAVLAHHEISDPFHSLKLLKR